jgi:hypothetical protein
MITLKGAPLRYVLFTRQIASVQLPSPFFLAILFLLCQLRNIG